MKTKGFTLVELLVVIAILAILATVSVVGYTSFIDRAEQSNADTEAHQIESAIESVLMIPGEVYEISTGYYVAPVTVDSTTKNVVAKVESNKYVEIGTGVVDLTAAFKASDDFGELVGEDETFVFLWDADSDTLYYIPGGHTEAAVPGTDVVCAKINFNN